MRIRRQNDRRITVGSKVMARKGYFMPFARAIVEQIYDDGYVQLDSSDVVPLWKLVYCS